MIWPEALMLISCSCSDKKEKQDNFVTKEDGSSSKKDSEEKELTVREKFYLFLEKGFCPELEKGVDDPMYKYTGGQNREGEKCTLYSS